jgi:hypothetical protein
MSKSSSDVCKKCGKKIKEGGLRAVGKKTSTVVCDKCLKAIFPEGENLPVTMDKDGNLYFIDEQRQVMFIFFGYGDVPYSSCTEMSLEENQYGCGMPFFE